MTANTITDEQFESEVLGSEIPVLVDFYAEWCGPCKAMAPTLDEVAGEMSDKVKIFKMNVEESPDSPTKYGVRAVPTLMIFKGGEMVAQNAGALQKSALVQFLEDAI